MGALQNIMPYSSLHTYSSFAQNVLEEKRELTTKSVSYIGSGVLKAATIKSTVCLVVRSCRSASARIFGGT
jgi:hypothetical protein